MDGDGMMWQEVLKKKGILSTLAMQRHKALGKKRKKNEEKELIENQWFNTVKEAGAISTATPGFIPRPRYKKKKKWNIIKLTEKDMQNRPSASEVHSIVINPSLFINITNPYHTGKPYTKDSAGWNKWKQLIELISKEIGTKYTFREGDSRYDAEPEQYVVKDENGNLIPKFWDSNTGWNIYELDNEIMELMRMEGESGYKPLPSNRPFIAPPPPRSD